MHDLCFFWAQVQLTHSSSNLPLANNVSITFELAFQKNKELDAIITVHWTGDAIIAWASTVQCISIIPNTLNKFPFCMYQQLDNNAGLVTSKQVLHKVLH
jgi:hypothetical protein